MPSRVNPASAVVQHEELLLQLPYSPLFRSASTEIQDLMRVAVGLYTREKRLGIQFSDYSFVVFPMAKAYEGFLKQYLFQLHLLSPEEYQGRKFRIGRALNPDLRSSQRDDQWLYDDLVRLCSADLGRTLWNTWLECRNRVFHFFPGAAQRLTLHQAGSYLVMMVEAMNEALRCQRDHLQR